MTDGQLSLFADITYNNNNNNNNNATTTTEINTNSQVVF